MKDRILALMSHEGMTPSKFAEAIGIQRAAMSHIIAGRNNPSLDVATKIMKRFKTVNPNWLLLGQGEMFTESENTETPLFQNEAVLPTVNADASENCKEIGVETSINNQIIPVNQQIVYKEKTSKEVSRIIIYYSDNSFEEFLPEKINKG
jgi:plasmid maintenance system antidote protein VapI